MKTGPKTLPELLLAVSSINASKNNEISSLKLQLAEEYKTRRRFEMISSERAKRITKLEALFSKTKKPERLMGLDLVTEFKWIVADVCQVEFSVVNRKGRRFSWQTWPKHLAMYFCVKFKLGSQEFIEKKFGYRSHGIVIHAVKMVSSDISYSGLHKTQHDECLRRMNRLMTAREAAAGGA